MNFFIVVVTVFAFAYLMYVMLWPEKF